MFPDSTTRFSKRVGNYVRFRPGYPDAVVELLQRESGLTADSTVADVGSGTGLLSRVFLDFGSNVIGVEPNREMREAGHALLAGYPRFRSVDAHAEATTLEDCSVDLVVAGQAFHWFDPVAARREWTRILRRGGMAALIWNKKRIESPFMREVEAVIDSYAAESDGDGSIREAGQSRIAGFFAPASFQVAEFPNEQRFDSEGLLGRVVSSSYLPSEGEPRFDEMASEIARVFARHQDGGMVRFEYLTKIYWGSL